MLVETCSTHFCIVLLLTYFWGFNNVAAKVTSIMIKKKAASRIRLRLFISFVLLNELKRGWWSSIYMVVLFGIIYIYPCNNFIDYISTISRRRANKRKQRCDKWNGGCAFLGVTLAYRCVIFTSLWPSILQMVSIGTPASSVMRLANECRHECTI